MLKMLYLKSLKIILTSTVLEKRYSLEPFINPFHIALVYSHFIFKPEQAANCFNMVQTNSFPSHHMYTFYHEHKKSLMC